MTDTTEAEHRAACMAACDGDCEYYYEHGLPEPEPPAVRPEPAVQHGTVRYSVLEVPVYDRLPSRWDGSAVGETWSCGGRILTCVQAEPPDNSIWSWVNP